MAEKKTHDSTSLMLSLMPRSTTEKAAIEELGKTTVKQEPKDDVPKKAPTSQPSHDLSHVVTQCFTSEHQQEEQPR